MKKILGISATQAKFRLSTSEYLLDVALESAKKCGSEIDKIKLIDYDFNHCQGCSTCMQLMPCPLGKKDGILDLLTRIEKADAFIISYPVYGYVAPEILFKLFHRFSPKENLKNEFSRYLVDITSIVKGWPIANKEVAVICTGATIGMESAIQSIYNPLRGLRANIVASIGIGMMEYDCSPHLAQKPFARDIGEADFAIDMAQAIGERITMASSGFDKSYKFKDPYMKDDGQIVVDYLKRDNENKIKINEIKKIDKKSAIYDLDGNSIVFDDIIKESCIFVIGGPLAIETNVNWTKELEKLFDNEIKVYAIAEANAAEIPVPKEFIVGQIKSILDGINIFIDWDVYFNKNFGVKLDSKYSTLIYVDEHQEVKIYNELEYCTNNIKLVETNVKKLIHKEEKTDFALQEKSIRINNLNLSYYEMGNGPEVLIIHGNRDTKEYFKNIIMSLAKKHKVYALDLRGHGKSERPDTGYYMENFISDCRTFINRMKLSNYCIIGHSLGATIAMKIALDDNRVDRLVLMGTSANFHPNFRPENIKPSNIGSTNIDNSDIKKSIQDAVGKYFFTEGYDDIKKQVSDYWSELPSTFHKALVMELKHPDMRTELAKIKNKTLVIAGEKDKVTLADECKFVAENIENSSFEVITGCGHFMYMEKQEVVINLIDKFLDK